MHYYYGAQADNPNQKSLVRLVCLVVFLFLSSLFLCMPSYASEAVDENDCVKASIETVLRNYAEEALLYKEMDQRVCTVSDPSLTLSEDVSSQSFKLSGKEKTLAQLQDNISFLEKKAGFYSAIRQAQGIYREDLQLTYAYRKLELEEDTGFASVVENAGFRYTDSERTSVYETIYSVDLVKLGGQWLVADVTDGSQFDTDYKKAAGFDVQATLDEYQTALQTDSCKVIYPLSWSAKAGVDGPYQVLYNGEQAAAYAYTYARQWAGQPREEFYSPQFENYAGRGGDCMNFASQCMWAGFGGSQTTSSIDGHLLPMDTTGADTWFGRSTAARSTTKNTTSWISCQSFRKYLTGTYDGLGLLGSNPSKETGMYATILHAAAGSPLSGVSAEELVGAVAHVEGLGGLHAHAIVLTAATGNSRNEIYFCSHTKDMNHIKLGDYYFGPIKAYIPRFLRTSTSQANTIRMDRIPPVNVSDSETLGFHCDEKQYSMTIAVTAPGETSDTRSSVSKSNTCSMDYRFETPGLYRVDCYAQPTETAKTAKRTFYVRCLDAAGSPDDVSEPDSDIPTWLLNPDGDEFS